MLASKQESVELPVEDSEGKGFRTAFQSDSKKVSYYTKPLPDHENPVLRQVVLDVSDSNYSSDGFGEEGRKPGKH